MNDRSKNAKAAAVTNLITGAKKLFTNGAQVVALEGKSMTVDNATAGLQTFVDNRAATVAAQATAKTRVAAENAQAPALLALIGAFEAFVRLTVGNDAAALAGFGLAPAKVRTPTDGGGQGGRRREAQGNSRGAGHDERQAEEEREGQRDGGSRRHAGRRAGSCRSARRADGARCTCSGAGAHDGSRLPRPDAAGTSRRA